MPVVITFAVEFVVSEVAEICKGHLTDVAAKTLLVKSTVLDFQHELVINHFRTIATNLAHDDAKQYEEENTTERNYMRRYAPTAIAVENRFLFLLF